MKSFVMLLAGVLYLLAGAAVAEETKSKSCRLIVDARTGKIIVRDGPCESQRSPCSTFKIPLAVMGFDAGILKDEHQPAWDYLPEYNASRSDDRQTIDPASWEKLSVVWYSQKLTRTLGKARFKSYVDQFKYGNQDVTGDPGKDNGLTESWLLSSLLISPDEQVEFIQKLLNKKLGVTDHAYETVIKILPSFKAEDGWILTGKTGSGFQRKADGALDRKLNEGWFVGWATNGGRKVIFAELLIDETPHEGYGGPRSRDALILALPKIMRDEKSAP